MPNWLSFLIGLFLGANLGCLALALCVAARRGGGGAAPGGDAEAEAR